MNWLRMRIRVTNELKRLCNKPRPATAPQQIPVTPASGSSAAPQDTLGTVIFARLLLELPQHRQTLESATQANDHEQLALWSHKLAGAVAYCNLPELSAALDELRQMLDMNNTEQTRHACHMVNRCITALIESSGARQA